MRIDALIVTYGNRWHLLHQTIGALLKHDAVRHITVMNNGVSYDLHTKLNALDPVRIDMIDMGSNTGSAYAFGTGLQHLSNDTSVEYILLLDDDLLPEDHCLATLQKTWYELSRMHPVEQVFLQCMRPDRAYLRHAAKGVHQEIFFPQPDHFLGFNLFRNDLRKAKRSILASIHTAPDQAYVRIPCAPYGGLCMHRSAIPVHGIPDIRFHTYADDFDYTLRMTRNGGMLYLVPDAIVRDMEQTLVNQKKEGIFSVRFFDMPDRRLFLLIRNTIFFTQTHLVIHPRIFQCNRILYSAYLLLSALLHGKMSSYKIYNFAVRQGMRGILRNEDIPAQ